MSPEFSVVLPTRGDSPHLRTSLASALDHGADVEVLLTHDRRPGERPLPRDLLTDPRVHPLEAEYPGLPGARNTALASARGRYLALLDDDDLWLPGHLERAVAALGLSPDAVLVASDAYLFEDTSADGSSPQPRDLSSLPRFRPDLPAGPLPLRTLLLANPIVASAVVMVRERLGPGDRFDQGLPSLEDYDLWLRLARVRPLLFEPRPAVLIRRRRGAMSRNWRRMAESGLEILGRFADDGLPDGTLTHAELRRRLGRLWHDLAYACLIEEDLAGARASLREAISHCPMNGKNYAYALASLLPMKLRRAVFARGRIARDRGRATGDSGVRSSGHPGNPES